MASPRFRRARAHKFIIRTPGDLTLAASATAWAAVDTGSDLTLDAQVGDTITVNAGAYVSSVSSAMFFDVASMVSGSPVNYWGGSGGSGDFGITAWTVPSGGAAGIGGAWPRAISAGDLVNGKVTLRLLYRGGGATVNASAGRPLMFMIDNIGPVAPY
jgi:hypothetical protein